MAVLELIGCSDKLIKQLNATIVQYLKDLEIENENLKKTIEEMGQKLEQREYNRRFANKPKEGKR